MKHDGGDRPGNQHASASGPESSQHSRRTGTRRRIEQVALELFAQQGYEKTSLREIAERVGVTKAALYYHFKNKEAILAGVIQDLVSDVDELIKWAADLPPTVGNRRRVLKRLSALFSGQLQTIMWVGHEQQAVFRDLPAAEGLREQMQRLFTLLRDPDAALADQLRSVLAMLALFVVHFNPAEIELWGNMPDEERRAVGLEVALDLIEPKEPRPVKPGADSSTPTP